MKFLINLIFLYFIVCVVRGHPNYNVERSDDDSSRIIGGTNVTNREKYPFIVALQYIQVHSDGSVTGKGSFCGGSIVNSRWIVTASHCVQVGSEDGVAIVAGNTDLTFDDEHTQRILIEKIYRHPVYVGILTNFNDIAMLYLKQSLTFSKYVQPIELQKPGYVPSGSAIVIGWGLVNDTGKTEDTQILRETGGQIKPRINCSWHNYYTEKTQICFGKTEATSCQGDSGGPLIQITDGVARLIGVVSYGFVGCFGYSIYTNVAEYLESFVNKLIQKHDSIVLTENSIVKGVQKIPFVVSIHMYPNVVSGKINFGTIVGEEWVLTTAHCLNLDETGGQGLYIIAGVDNPFDEEDTFARRTIKVQRVVRHPYYQRGRFIHNVALLKLSEPIIMKHLLRKAKLPHSTRYQPVGTLRVAGFALKEDVNEGHPVPQNNLVSTTVHYEPTSSCHRFSAELTKDSGMCLKPSHVDLCSLDEGGPLYDETETVIGLGIVRSIPCGFKSELYEKVTNNLDFILRTIGPIL